MRCDRNISRETCQTSARCDAYRSESLDAAQRDDQTAIAHLDTRRNLLTQGVPLNHLVGQTFQIGDVLLRGVELCEPCRHLQKLTFREILKPLIHRGGLRAEIGPGGSLQIGMKITPE